MSEYRPDYYGRFRCAASACTDSCCAGWEIDIDPGSAARYRAVPGPFGERLRREIAWEDAPPHFRLREDGRCPFLNGENLCDIYINCGKDALCAICAGHPRFHAEFGPHRESGLGLCCEAAAALILDTSRPARFVLDGSLGEAGISERFRALFAARGELFSIARSRSLPLEERMLRLLLRGAEVQDQLDEVEICPFPEAGRFEAPVGALAALLAELEPLDPSWPGRVRGFSAVSPEALTAAAAADAAAYENLLVYFLFRYLLRAAEDGEFLARVKLAVLLTLTVQLLDAGTLLRTGRLTPEDRLRNAVSCSKELEYSEENLAALEDACVWEEAFSLDRLIRVRQA